MAGKEISPGRLLVREGRIAKVGARIGRPPDAEEIDAGGRLVMPGLIDAHSHLGMWESMNGFEGSDGNEKTDPVTPHLRAVDAVNPMDITFEEARNAGVTCVATGPGSANVIGGTFAAIKTAGTRVDDMLVREPVAMKCAFGKNPKSACDAKGKAPSTRMAIAAILREALFQALRYEEKIASAGDDLSKLPDFNMKYEALLPVLRREIPLKAHAHRTDDMFTAIRIAREFNLRLTLDHATEGHLIADVLAAENIPCIVGPSFGHRSKDELRHKSFDTAGALARVGVKIAITTDSPVSPLHSLPMMAALAVKSGLDRETALRAITVNPAEILGIDDRVGTLAPGKDADLVIFDGDPLEIQSRPWKVIVSGRVVYES
jgi:imidazolonepropionase-like amidohydrolase